jgi:predicted TPR repeat methyltransferase
MTDPLKTDHPIAERRYAYAQAAARERDWQAAAEVLEQTLEIDPRWAAAWFALGEARERLSDLDAARHAFGETLRLDAADRQGASLRLAALDGRRPDSLPPAYVARLFDDYAPRFASHLTVELAYRGPEVLSEALTAAAPGRRFRRALDLGCGSGLAGAVLRTRTDVLVGVDLSPGMIEEARRSGLYDALEVGDVVTFLNEQAIGGADLVAAADVFVYLGDLAPALGAAARTLAADGLLAFTVEAESGERFSLGPGLRFRHSRTYLASALAAAGLGTLTLEAASSRREAGAEVEGFVVVAEQRKDPFPPQA